MRSAALAITLLGLSACAGGPAAIPTAYPAPGSASARPAPAEGFREPNVQRSAGLDGVIGTRSAALTARFGKPRIDLTEGDARKLQFASNRCVLDIFLYPRAAGSEPVATHVEARERRGGADTDPARCIREVEAR